MTKTEKEDLLKICRLEPHTPIRLLLDRSLSMGTGAIPKFDYARKLAAALCYVGLVRVEHVSIHPFNDVLAEPFRCAQIDIGIGFAPFDFIAGDNNLKEGR